MRLPEESDPRRRTWLEFLGVCPGTYKKKEGGCPYRFPPHSAGARLTSKVPGSDSFSSRATDNAVPNLSNMDVRTHDRGSAERAAKCQAIATWRKAHAEQWSTTTQG